MTKGVAIVAAFVLISSAAFAQGAAEAALAHSLSTSMGAAVGKAMGNVTNTAAGQVSGRVKQQISTSRRAPVPVPVTSKPIAQTMAQRDYGTTAEPPNGGSLIQSIEGAGPRTCVITRQSENPAAAANSKTPDVKAPDTAQKENSCPPALPYKAVINLPAAK
jgi:hypothetical protein